MSTNCINCVKNKRTGNDLLCDECRKQETVEVIRRLEEEVMRWKDTFYREERRATEYHNANLPECGHPVSCLRNGPDGARCIMCEQAKELAAEKSAREAAERERDEARFRPGFGDNHHNAAKCPYCSPHVKAMEKRAEAAELRVKAMRKALEKCVSALDAMLGDSDLPEDDRPGVIAIREARATLSTTPQQPPRSPPSQSHECGECGKLREEVKRVRALIARDQTGLANAMNEVRRIAEGYSWLPAGEWGSYGYEEQTEETLRKELGFCFEQLRKVIGDALNASGKLAYLAFHPELPTPAVSSPQTPPSALKLVKLHKENL